MMSRAVSTAAIRSGRALPPVASAPQMHTPHLRSRGASRFRPNPLSLRWCHYIAELMYLVVTALIGVFPQHSCSLTRAGPLPKPGRRPPSSLEARNVIHKDLYLSLCRFRVRIWNIQSYLVTTLCVRANKCRRYRIVKHDTDTISTCPTE